MHFELSKRSMILLIGSVLRKSFCYRYIDVHALLLRHWTAVKPYLQARVLITPPVSLPYSHPRVLAVSDHDEENILAIDFSSIRPLTHFIPFWFYEQFLLRFVDINVDSFALCGD